MIALALFVKQFKGLPKFCDAIISPQLELTFCSDHVICWFVFACEKPKTRLQKREREREREREKNSKKDKA